MIRVVIIIVNYRTADLVRACLDSLAADSWIAQHCRVVIVDNASGDGSAGRLRHAAAPWEDWVSLMESPANSGFAAGNNLAIRAVMEAAERPEYVLLLNPDTIVDVGAVGTLVGFMEQHRAVGIAGSRLRDLNGMAQTSAFRFHNILGELESGLRLGMASRIFTVALIDPKNIQQISEVTIAERKSVKVNS